MSSPHDTPRILREAHYSADPPDPNAVREEPLGWTGLPTGRQLWGCALVAVVAMSLWALLDWAFPFAWWAK